MSVISWPGTGGFLIITSLNRRLKQLLATAPLAPFEMVVELTARGSVVGLFCQLPWSTANPGTSGSIATHFQTSRKTDCFKTLTLINITTLTSVPANHHFAAGCRLDNPWLYTHSSIRVAQFAAPERSGSGFRPESPSRDVERPSVVVTPYGQMSYLGTPSAINLSLILFSRLRLNGLWYLGVSLTMSSLVLRS